MVQPAAALALSTEALPLKLEASSFATADAIKSINRDT